MNLAIALIALVGTYTVFGFWEGSQGNGRENFECLWMCGGIEFRIKYIYEFFIQKKIHKRFVFDDICVAVVGMSIYRSEIDSYVFHANFLWPMFIYC